MTNAFPIPDAALDDRLAFVGTAGSGKTYAAGTAVERLLASKARVVIIDPLDVWFGLRLNADGRQDAFPVVIFGGAHGDLALTENSGALVGETVAGMAESCIVSLSALGTKASERRFMLAFLTALYRQASGSPVHLVFDEADMWAPQRLMDRDGDAARLLGQMETIVRRGRVKGFIPWLITQRPAVLSKDVLSQADGLVALKLTASQDRDALGAWIEGQADKAEEKRILARLPQLARGDGVIWIPGRGVLAEASFPLKATFDSSRTPKRGEEAKSATLRPLDLAGLRARLTTVEEEGKANDPKALRAEIARLKSAKPAAPDDSALRAEIARMGAEIVRLTQEADSARARVLIAAADRVREVVTEIEAMATKDVRERASRAVAVSSTPRQAVAPSPRAKRAKDGLDAFSAPQRRVLRAVAMWKAIGHDAPSREMVAAVSGYSPTSGGFANLIGSLGPKSAAALEIPRPGYLSLTINGFAPPSVEEGRNMLLSILSNPQRKLVDALNGAGVVSREKLGELTDYSHTSGGFNNLIGSLNTLAISYVPAHGHIALNEWAQRLLEGHA